MSAGARLPGRRRQPHDRLRPGMVRDRPLPGRRAHSPIAVLWVLLLPLADCVSLMTRRRPCRQESFVADRHHIHHYLLARGFQPRQDARHPHRHVGDLRIGRAIPAGAREFPRRSFWPFFFGYFAYHAWIKRAWSKVDAGADWPARPTRRGPPGSPRPRPRGLRVRRR